MQSIPQGAPARPATTFNPDSLNADRPPVIRSYALSVDAFDFFKEQQRRIEAAAGTRMTNGQALEALLSDYARRLRAPKD